MRHSILIVDDHAGFRQSARGWLEVEGFEVIGEAADASEAIAKCDALHPDIVLLDVQLPDRDGFWVAEQLAACDQPPIVVLISSRHVAAYRSRLDMSPARGFIAKDELSGQALLDLTTGSG